MTSLKTETNNIFSMIFKSCVLYIKHFFCFSRVMLFPVFGQLAGIILIFYPVYLYREHYLLKLSAEYLQQNIFTVFLVSLVILIPGLAVFLKAFWDYMIAMVSLNIMAADFWQKGSAGNFKVYNNSVKLKTGSYISLLLIISVLWLLVTILPFLAFFFPSSALFMMIILFIASIILSILLAVYFSLVFQIFAFESLSPMKIMHRSLYLLKGNFWRTFFMGIFLFLITGFTAELLNMMLEKSFLMKYIVLPFESYVNIFAKSQDFIETLAKYKLTPFSLSIELALNTTALIIISFMLPLGSACFTLLYYDICNRKKAKIPTI